MNWITGIFSTNEQNNYYENPLITNGQNNYYENPFITDQQIILQNHQNNMNEINRIHQERMEAIDKKYEEAKSKEPFSNYFSIDINTNQNEKRVIK